MIRNMYGIFWVLFCVGAVACADGESDARGTSPTGTYLDPKDGLGEVGYEVLDEVCDNTDDPHYIERFVTPMFRDITVVGDVAYLVDGSLLWAVSIASPSSPERLSLTRLPGHPKSIAAGGNYLFAANGTNGVSVIDVALPNAPAVIATIDNLPGISLDVAISENTLYISAGEGGLVTADITDPTSPTILSSTAIPGFANAVTVTETTAYVAACSHVAVVDAVNPASPVLLQTVLIPDGHAREVAVEDGRLVAASGEALFLIDVRNPLLPNLVSFYSDPFAEGFYVNAVALKDGIAYIAAGDESFRAVDIIRMTSIASYVSPSTISKDIDAPVEVDPPGTLFIVNSDPIGISIHEDKLFVLGNFRWVGERLLRILDIATPYDQPVDVGRYAQPKTVVGVNTFGGEIFTHISDGTTIISNANGAEINTINLPSPVKKMATSGDTVYLLLENGDIYRTADFGTYAKIGEYANDMAVSAQIAAISDALANALVVENVGAFFTTQTPAIALEDAFLGFSALFAEGDRVYAYDWALGKLHVVKRIPDNTLQYMGNLNIGECEGYDVADYYTGRHLNKVQMQKTDDGIAFLCPFDPFGMSSVIFLAFNNPDAPTVVNRIELPEGRYGDFQIEGNAIYTVGFDNNRYESVVSRFEANAHRYVKIDGGANGVAVVGTEIFVSDYDQGLLHFRYENDELIPVISLSAGAGGQK